MSKENGRALIVDIETYGEDTKEMDKVTRDALGKKNKHKTGLIPYTGEIVAIGILDSEQNKGKVFFQAPGKDLTPKNVNDNIALLQKTEEEMLNCFWEAVEHYNGIVTYNGNSFDAPFLILRSILIYGIEPTVDLMENRYLSNQYNFKHVDLLDQIRFYNAARFPRDNMHLVCRAAGIESPKTKEAKGSSVQKMFDNEEYQKIARYNARDIEATRELYLRLKDKLFDSI